MFDFKTFAQMNLDIIFKGFPSLPKSGEEVFATQFDLQLGGGPMLYPIVLHSLGCKVALGTFLSENEPSNICIRLMRQMDFNAYQSFETKETDPVVVTSVLSFDHDRSFIAYNRFVNESCLTEGDVYDFLKDSYVVSAPIGHPDVVKRLHNDGVKIVFDVGWDDSLYIDNLKEILPYVDIFAPNDKEAIKMTGTSTLTEALMFLKEYTKTPIITTGKDGCIFYEDGVKTIPAITEFESIDTTGAGDNFITGIIYGIIHKNSLADCLRLGTIFAGNSTTQIGCYGAKITHDIIQSKFSLSEENYVN